MTEGATNPLFGDQAVRRIMQQRDEARSALAVARRRVTILSISWAVLIAGGLGACFGAGFR